MDCKVAVKDTQTQWLGGRPSHCHCKHPAASPDHKNTEIGETPISSMTEPKNMCGKCSQSFYVQHMEPMHISIKQKYITYPICYQQKRFSVQRGGGRGFFGTSNIQGTEVPQHQHLHIEDSHPIHLPLRTQRKKPTKRMGGTLKESIMKERMHVKKNSQCSKVHGKTKAAAYEI
jgi:hypothetical protein